MLMTFFVCVLFALMISSIKHMKASPAAAKQSKKNLPVSTDVNGWRGSKGHLSLPDSAVEDSSLKVPS